MKYLLSLVAVCFITTISLGQVTKIDTTEIEKPLIGIDTIAKMPIELEEVFISNRRNFKSEEERKNLIADHFLFKEGDRFLEACGLNREWPDGRGIFHNNSKTFLVWVNEEDQLRIISM